MEFKHIAFLVIFFTCLWSIFVSGISSIEDLGSIQLNSELSAVNDEGNSETNFGKSPIENKFESIVKVLNFGIPLSLLAVVLLGLTYKTNPIGLFPMILAIAMFLFATTKSMDSITIIEATTDFTVDARVWWMI